MFHNFPNNTAALSNVSVVYVSRRYYDANSSSIHGQPVNLQVPNRTFREYVDVIR